MNARNEGRLPMLSEVLAKEKVHQCVCGSFAFFAWGVKLLFRGDYGLGRSRDWGTWEELVICAGCHRPVVVNGGDMYDATEFVTPEEVERLILYGAARQHRVPVSVMDP